MARGEDKLAAVAAVRESGEKERKRVRTRKWQRCRRLRMGVANCSGTDESTRDGNYKENHFVAGDESDKSTDGVERGLEGQGLLTCKDSTASYSTNDEWSLYHNAVWYHKRIAAPSNDRQKFKRPSSFIPKSSSVCLSLFQMADDINEILLRRYRLDIHSMCASFPEPASAYKIKMEFLDNFDDEVPFRRFGYQSLDAFLTDHADLVKVSHDGKDCYKAKMTEATQDIQSLIAKQKKKKKRGPQKKGRGSGMPRGGYNRSFVNRNPPNFSNQPARYANRGGKSFTSSSRAANIFSPPDHFVRVGTLNTGPNNQWGTTTRTIHQAEIQSNILSRTSLTKPIPSAINTRIPVPAPTAFSAKEDPSTGVSHIMQALDKCGGNATLTKLNWAYQSLFGKQLDATEMTKYFGTKNMRKIHSQYLSEKVELNPGYGGQWSFISKENALKQKEWETILRTSVVDAPRYKWDKPSVRQLYDKTVDMLVNMYPETIHIDNMAEIYKRAHGVLVNPMELYCKNWDDLVLTTFKDKLRLTANRHVALTPAAIKSHKLSGMSSHSPQKISKVQRVTADDLGLEYSTDEEDEDDSSFSAPSLDDLNLIPLPPDNPPIVNLDEIPLPPPHRNISSKQSDENYLNHKMQLPTIGGQKPERRSIFDRITVPAKEIPNLRKGFAQYQQQPTSNVFGYSTNSNLRDVESSAGARMKSSVFEEKHRNLSRQPDGLGRIQEQMNKLHLLKRDEHMDFLLKAEQTKELGKINSPKMFGSEKGFGKPNSPVKVPVTIGKIDFSPLNIINPGHKGKNIFDREENRSLLNLNITRNAQAILKAYGSNSLPTQNQNNTPASPVKNQFSSFGPPFEKDFSVSPGQFNVKFNGKSEQLSNAVRSRRTIYDASSE